MALFSRCGGSLEARAGGKDVKKEQMVGTRLPLELVSELELIEDVEQSDRSTTVRRLLSKAIRQWKLDHYVRLYGEEKLTLARAAREAGVSLWEMMDYARTTKVPVQYDLDDLERDVGVIYGSLNQQTLESRTMSIWKLEPKDTNHPAWETSTCKKAVLVRASDKRRARARAREEFWTFVERTTRGDAVRTPPWTNPGLVDAYRVNNTGYPDDGPEEILKILE